MAMDSLGGRLVGERESYRAANDLVGVGMGAELLGDFIRKLDGQFHGASLYVVGPPQSMRGASALLKAAKASRQRHGPGQSLIRVNN